MKLGVMASHTGTNFQSILDAWSAGELAAEPVVAISNNSDSIALQRAAKHGIPTYHLSGRTHPDPDRLDAAVVDTLNRHGVDLVVLAGYMKRLGKRTLETFRGRIINIHPSLLPKYGGRGMFGINVHRAVIDNGETESGASIHVVTAEYDAGPVVAQERMAVQDDDTPESLAARILVTEHRLLVTTIARIAAGEIDLDGAMAQHGGR